MTVPKINKLARFNSTMVRKKHLIYDSKLRVFIVYLILLFLHSLSILSVRSLQGFMSIYLCSIYIPCRPIILATGCFSWGGPRSSTKIVSRFLL
jgi:pilus assembly protein TadC